MTQIVYIEGQTEKMIQCAVVNLIRKSRKEYAQIENGQLLPLQNILKFNGITID